MDKYSQRNCRLHGIELLKVSGRKLLTKKYGDSRWRILKLFSDVKSCYVGALQLSKNNTKYVKI